MVRTDKYKLILYPDAKNIQLFDLEKNPWEISKDNLAGDPGYSTTISELFHKLKKWQDTVNDTLVLDATTFGIQT